MLIMRADDMLAKGVMIYRLQADDVQDREKKGTYMTHNYQFNTADWQKDFAYAIAPHTKAAATYTCDGGVLKNEYNEKIGEHDYISVISNETFGVGTEISAKCSFSGTGAPCFVFTNDISGDADFFVYGLHFEVCVYVGGVNVWRIEPWPQRVERPIRTKKIHAVEWAPNTCELECTVKFGEGRITVSVEDHEFDVEWDEFPREFKVGFTACEGPCAFHEFNIKP